MTGEIMLAEGGLLVGRIHGIEWGMLGVSTDDMGTVRIERVAVRIGRASQRLDPDAGDGDRTSHTIPALGGEMRHRWSWRHHMQRTALLWLLSACTCLVALPAPVGAQDTAPPATPTTVEVAIIMLDLERIDDAAQGFSANVFLVARWKDPRLAHDGGGVERLDLDDIWHPRLQVVNRRRVSRTLPMTADVTPDGEVTYRQRVVGEFSQRLDLADFPLDRQTLAIQVVAVGYSQDEVRFAALPDIPSTVLPDLSISDWMVLGSRASSRGYQPLPSVRPTAGFELELDVERKVGYYAWKILLPLLLIVAMSWLVFWIDPEMAGPQISVAVTSMLTLIAYRFMVAGMLPRISYLTRMDLFTTASTVLVFVTLIEAVLTVMSTKHGHHQTAMAIDRFSRWGFPLAYVIAFVGAFLL